LLAGNDVRSMTDETRDILTNKEVIAIDQDPLGQQGRRVSKEGATEVWAKPLANGDLAVALFNRSSQMADVTVYWAILGIDGKHKVRDLWRHEGAGTVRDSYSADVPQHGVVMLRIAR
jgi:alpha-galactosidase